MLPDRLEGGGRLRPAPRRVPPSLGRALQNQVDADAALRRSLQFLHHLDHTERREADDQQRLLAVADQLGDNGAGEPDRGGIASRAADDDVAALSGRLPGVLSAAVSSARASARRRTRVGRLAMRR